MKHGLFISGTDTGIGKTFVSALLLASLRQHGISGGYFKPIQTGEEEDDTTTLRSLAGGASGFLDPPPVYRFSAPQAPARAAALENQVILTDRICRAWAELPDAAWVVEGAGGLRVPIATRVTIRELIVDLQLPVLFVASTRLGTINHTLMSLESAQSAGIRIAGLILNGEPDEGLSETLRGFTSVPILAEIPRLVQVTRESIAALAPRVFPRSVLDRLFAVNLPPA